MASKNLEQLKSFSELFGVSKDDVVRLGFFDITPAVDSALYIDAKLLKDFNIPHFSNAANKLRQEFSKILSLISKCSIESNDDIFYKAAFKALDFVELQGTCLGYSQDGTIGRGVGDTTRKTIISNIKQLMSKGPLDPEILELICVFTDGFGCDLSSDLVTFLLKDIIFDYNLFIIEELGLEKENKVDYFGVKLLENPYRKGKPLILLPKDILSDLPLCNSYEDICYVYKQNEEARQNLQVYIDANGTLAKDKVLELLLTDDNLLRDLLDSYKSSSAKGYDYESDPLCVWKFRDIIAKATDNYPGIFAVSGTMQTGTVKDIASECLKIFKHLIEDCGGRNQIQKFSEKGIQFLFFATSYYICKSNNISLCPEVNHGRGPIDFFLTDGGEKISIEFKKSKNQQYKHGLSVQLPNYMDANDSVFGYYVFMNYDSIATKKIRYLYDVYNSMPEKRKTCIEIVVIQSTKLDSASVNKD